MAASSVAAFAPAEAEARRVRWILDLDGTVNDDQSDRSTWRTYWVLERIDQQHTMMSPVPASVGAPAEVFVSYREYLQHISRFGRDGLFNDTAPIRLDFDPAFPQRPLEFVPGWYQVNPSVTFRYYRPAARGDGYLVRDLNFAVQRARALGEAVSSERPSYLGPGFELLEAGLESLETVGDVVISTSRWHADHEWAAFFARLRELGHVRHDVGVGRDGRPTRPRVHNLNSPESRLLSVDVGHLAEAKARVVWVEANDLLNGPREPGSAPGEPDVLVAAEDDPRFVDSMVRQMEELSGTGHFAYDVRFMLLNASRDEFLPRARYPYRWITFERGRGRPSTPEEIADVLPKRRRLASARSTGPLGGGARSCAAYFGDAGGSR